MNAPEIPASSLFWSSGPSPDLLKAPASSQPEARKRSMASERIFSLFQSPLAKQPLLMSQSAHRAGSRYSSSKISDPADALSAASFFLRSATVAPPWSRIPTLHMELSPLFPSKEQKSTSHPFLAGRADTRALRAHAAAHALWQVPPSFRSPIAGFSACTRKHSVPSEPAITAPLPPRAERSTLA